jgi:transcription initiation factor TFIID subunit TAF12
MRLWLQQLRKEVTMYFVVCRPCADGVGINPSQTAGAQQQQQQQQNQQQQQQQHLCTGTTSCSATGSSAAG